MVVVRARGVVERALLASALDAARGGLLDVDVRDGRGGVVGVLLDGEGDGGEADGFASEPTEALEGEGWVGGGGDGFILGRGLVGRVEG